MAGASLCVMEPGEHETLLDADDYLRSLSVERTFTSIYETDGSALFRITPEHFVIISTRCEHKHLGLTMLRRVVPVRYEEFHRVANKDAGWDARHYGPAL